VALWALREAAGRGSAERRAEALSAELSSLQRQLSLAEDRASAAERARDEAHGEAWRAGEPQATSAWIELGAAAEGRGEIEVELAAGERPTLLLLRPQRRLADPAMVVELRDARGATVWRSELARRDRGDRLAVVLPAGSLLTGRYEVRLSGIRAGRETPLAAWSIQVVSGG
jgi:hypothetical protein